MRDWQHRGSWKHYALIRIELVTALVQTPGNFKGQFDGRGERGIETGLTRNGYGELGNKFLREQRRLKNEWLHLHGASQFLKTMSETWKGWMISDTGIGCRS